MTKIDAYTWVENSFYGDLSEDEKIDNLKAMIDRVFNSFDIEGEYKINENGYITEFPQFGKFPKDKVIEIFSKVK